MTQTNLRTRAAAAAGKAPEPGTDVATAPPREVTIFDMIEGQKSALARALPSHLDADRLARIAVTVVKTTKGLEHCSVVSVLGGLMTCAQLGLEPGPLGEAYLIPFKGKAQLIIGYKGMIKLAWQSGQMHSIQAYVVHKADKFSYAYGLEPKIVHEPSDADDVGDVTHAYAVAKFKDGGVASVVLNRRDIDALKRRSQTWQNGPWQTDYEAMARKTAVRQLARWLPQSPQLQQFHQAAARDESLRTDWTVSLEESAPSWPSDDPAPAIESGTVVAGSVVEPEGDDPPDDAAAVAAAERAEAEAYEQEQAARRSVPKP